MTADRPDLDATCLHQYIDRYAADDPAVARLWACHDCKRRFYPACPECVIIGHRDEEHDPACSPDRILALIAEVEEARKR